MEHGQSSLRLEVGLDGESLDGDGVSAEGELGAGVRVEDAAKVNGAPSSAGNQLLGPHVLVVVKPEETGEGDDVAVLGIEDGRIATLAGPDGVDGGELAAGEELKVLEADLGGGSNRVFVLVSLPPEEEDGENNGDNGEDSHGGHDDSDLPGLEPPGLIIGGGGCLRHAAQGSGRVPGEAGLALVALGVSSAV